MIVTLVHASWGNGSVRRRTGRGIVDSGVSASVDVTLEISIPIFGGADASDSTSVNIDQSVMVVDPTPDSEPFSSLEITEHFIQTSGGSLVFEFCWPVVGCLETIDVTVNLLDVQLVGDQIATVDSSGNWLLSGVTYQMDLGIDYTGSLLGSGNLVTTQTALVDVTGGIQVETGLLVADNLDIGTIDIDVEDDSLPDGLNSLRITVDPDFNNLIYTGPYNLADLDGDGCVSGSDLTILLSNWGSCCQGDLDGNGVIGGADLTLLLSSWGC